MLITFSGIVGGGKSTNAKRTYHALKKEGHDALYLRFRFISWKRILRNQPVEKKEDAIKKTAEKKTQAKPDQALRTGSQRTLGLAPFLGYFWRMLNFRLFLKFRLKNRIGVCDRYFFDNFVHYHLTRKSERFYLAILKAVMPRPDVCFMFTASREVIVERRQHYDPKYLRRLWEQYESTLKEFPRLVRVNSDSFDHIDGLIAEKLSAVLCDNRQQSATQSLAIANTSDFERS